MKSPRLCYHQSKWFFHHPRRFTSTSPSWPIYHYITLHCNSISISPTQRIHCLITTLNQFRNKPRPQAIHHWITICCQFTSMSPLPSHSPSYHHSSRLITISPLLTDSLMYHYCITTVIRFPSESSAPFIIVFPRCLTLFNRIEISPLKWRNSY
jgi:hypothetical protein